MEAAVRFRGLEDGEWKSQMNHSLNSLKGGYMGDYIWDYYRGY